MNYGIREAPNARSPANYMVLPEETQTDPKINPKFTAAYERVLFMTVCLFVSG